MTKTQQISISLDGKWVGSGTLRDGVIVDCGAQFCDDNDESLEIYEMIEAAITKKRSSVHVRATDGLHVVTWVLI